MSQVRDESHVRLQRADAQAFHVFVTFSREILLFQTVLQMVFGLLEGAGCDPQEPGELLRVVTTESLGRISFRRPDGFANLIAVFEIA